jgi:hypothetical protein
MVEEFFALRKLLARLGLASDRGMDRAAASFCTIAALFYGRILSPFS